MKRVILAGYRSKDSRFEFADDVVNYIESKWGVSQPLYVDKSASTNGVKVVIARTPFVELLQQDAAEDLARQRDLVLFDGRFSPMNLVGNFVDAKDKFEFNNLDDSTQLDARLKAEDLYNQLMDDCSAEASSEALKYVRDIEDALGIKCTISRNGHLIVPFSE